MTAVMAETHGFCRPFSLSETLSNILLLYEISSFYPFTKCSIVCGRIAYSALIVLFYSVFCLSCRNGGTFFQRGGGGGGGGVLTSG